MAIRGGTNQACAVCKYQRKKCTRDCPLAPYFPSDRPKMFQNAHRLFGVRNIMSILRQVKADQRDEAMRSIKFEADMRARFPVHGCLGVVRLLKMETRQILEELQYVTTQLAIYKDRRSHGSSTNTATVEISSSSQSRPFARDQSDSKSVPLYQHYWGGIDEFVINGDVDTTIHNDDTPKAQNTYRFGNNSCMVEAQSPYPFQPEMQLYDYAQETQMDLNQDYFRN